jgi:CRP-like cAMP-binding protein
MALHPSLLQQFSLLRLLPAEALAALAMRASTHTFAKREVVLPKETPTQSLMFLLEGRLQAVDFTLDGREVGLHFIEEGAYFGEISVLDGLPPPEIIIANKKSQVVMVPAREARGYIFATPPAIEAMTSGLANVKFWASSIPFKEFVPCCKNSQKKVAAKTSLKTRQPIKKWPSW